MRTSLCVFEKPSVPTNVKKQYPQMIDQFTTIADVPSSNVNPEAGVDYCEDSDGYNYCAEQQLLNYVYVLLWY